MGNQENKTVSGEKINRKLNFSPCQNERDVKMELNTTTSFDSPMKVERESVHEKVVKEFGRRIIDNLKKKQIILTGDFEKNEIKSSHRKQMVVWIEEVLRIFKCPDDTFFTTVYIMDRYLESSKVRLELTELHEIGIVSMFIASKYQEVEPLTFDLMINKVAHGKITEEAIKSREIKIVNALNFRIGSPNVFNFLETYFEIYTPYFDSDTHVLLRESAIKMAKNRIVESKYAFKILPSELALRILIKTLKNQENLTGKFLLTEEFSALIKLEFISADSPVLHTDRESLFLGKASLSIEKRHS